MDYLKIFLIMFSLQAVTYTILRIYVSYDRYKYYYLFQGKNPPRFRLKYIWKGPQSNWTDPRDGVSNDRHAAANTMAVVSDFFDDDGGSSGDGFSGGGSGGGGFSSGSGSGGGGFGGGGGAGRR